MIDNAMKRLEKGLEAGVTPPKVTLRDVPQQVEEPDRRRSHAQSPHAAGLRAVPGLDISEPKSSRRFAERGGYTTYSEKIRARIPDSSTTTWSETYIPGSRESIAHEGSSGR